MTEDQYSDKLVESEGIKNDLTVDNIVQLDEVKTPEEKKSIVDSLQLKQENTRSTLASILIVILISTYVGCFIILGYLISYPEIKTGNKSELFTYTKDIFTLLLTTQTGLVGTVLGFYFGSRNNN